MANAVRNHRRNVRRHARHLPAITGDAPVHPWRESELWRGKLASGVSALWDEAVAIDVAESVRAVDVPVYFLHGKHDYIVSYPLAKAYLDQLYAPVKGFYGFEEPDRTLRIMCEDVLGGINQLADVQPQSSRWSPPFAIGACIIPGQLVGGAVACGVAHVLWPTIVGVIG